MSQLSTTPKYLMRWDHQSDQRLLRDVVRTTHRLNELPIFSDEGLASLIDCYPAAAMIVTTMGDNPAHPSELRHGTFADHDGRQWIDMIRRGRLCLRLTGVARHHDALGDLVNRLCGEMMECQPGLHTDSHDGDLWITSPYAIHYLGIDLQPAVFWQIRGQRRVSHYPLAEPFLLQRDLEQTVAGNSTRPLYYEPAFEQHAQTEQQAPGDALGLPLHTPHRITTSGTLSLTLTTSYQTRQSRRRNEILRANDRLHRWLPNQNRSLEINNAKSLAKRLMVRLVDRFAAPCQISPPEASFRVDPNATNCVAPIYHDPASDDSTRVEYSDRKSSSPIFPGLSIEPTTYANAGMEN